MEVMEEVWVEEVVVVTETKPDNKVRGAGKTIIPTRESIQGGGSNVWGFEHARFAALPWAMSGAMPTLCSRASASLLFLSRSESS